MISGIRGSLLSADALEHLVPDELRGRLDEFGRSRARHRLRAWHVPLRTVLGPAAAARAVFDRVAVPLFSQLGYRVVPIAAARDSERTVPICRARLDADGTTAAALVVTGWGQDPGVAWRSAVRQGIGDGVRWCFCATGNAVRVVDAVRTYARRFVEFDLTTVADHETTFAVFWGLLRAEAIRPSADGCLLDRAVAISEAHRAIVRSCLQDGVHDALAQLLAALSAAAQRRRGAARRATSEMLFNEALQIVYRILFLLFAEARGLVPRWHPIYRDGYTIESVRAAVERAPRPRGLWETLQSIARLAHRGCRIGTLRVTAFNGHLFSPAESPLAESLCLDDGAVRQALLSLTTRAGRAGRQRIAYGDLGVEQLGGVYERLLDIDPTANARSPLRAPVRSARHSDRRKATGSFYTPRSLTEFLVRRTLAPLVRDASPARILEVRVLDPAMGSGAFLVAACRYLAAAYESALLREGAVNGEDVGEHERAQFRRLVAQRCLYGVDVNPTAVQLGRLSLWLATLAADRPLTFLDHRLRAGNSLVGAGVADLARDPRMRRTGDGVLPLYDDPERDEQLRSAIDTRETIALEPCDTLSQVRAKEQALARLTATEGSLARWKAACDLWCAAWFGDRRPRGPGITALVDVLFERGGLPAHVAAPLLDAARAIAVHERFFHWTLEFPEVFHTPDGTRIDGAGFDAVIGNPPWEMLRGDRGDEATRGIVRHDAAALMAFARTSGVYRLQGTGHANLYQLFLERMLALIGRGGRLGAIVPWGLASDQGAASLRRRLLDATAIDTLISIENRDGLFPIHRGLKFLLVCATAGSGGARTALPCRFGVRRADDLERAPELGRDPEAIAVPRSLIERTDPASLSFPDIRDRSDVEILARIAFTIPALGDANGWHVHFGRELNATDDRQHFDNTAGPRMLPIIEGKHLSPFMVDAAAASRFIHEQRAGQLLDRRRSFGRARLAYRDVAAATNRLTLIAAIVPARVVTTHTLFCLRERLDADGQLYLCGMLNSFVANFLVRLRVMTHVTTAVIERLPMPCPAKGTAPFEQVVACAAALCRSPDDSAAANELQARAAIAYGLDPAQFRRVLDTFPLVPAADRDRVYEKFCDIVT
jgi:hypothetical protein